MVNDAKLLSILEAWEQSRQANQEATPDELCRDCPELLDEVRESIAALRATSWLDHAVQEGPTAGQAIGEPLPRYELRDNNATETAGGSGTTPIIPTVTADRRYHLVRLLGEGAFGRVWLAMDRDLERQVAIKIPAPGRFLRSLDADLYLTEARTVAGLDHPHIVPVYDTGRAADGSVFVVSKYIEGQNLAELIQSGCPAVSSAVALLATVARAAHYAHERHVIHRDIKPANILIDQISGIPYLTDFGLAIREEGGFPARGLAGTPTYMSPEQARGEGHRLDARSDVFSLGIILYELLTGQKPFQGDTIADVQRQVIVLEPPSPRQMDSGIPEEIERICMKAISKRASERYATAAQFANELEEWLHHSRPGSRPKSEVRVVPRGLRSFDQSDAHFYLDLLPGPRDRNGLPAVLAFWKSRIEERDADRTFRVGLVYGPSGCGKSSLVKAGLIPCLSNDVVVVYVEATSDQTEVRILRALRKRRPELQADMSLAESLATLRRSSDAKIFIIVDQLEQWLHKSRPANDAPLIAALRQCDGARVQAIVMLRDDFAMAAVRFMEALEVPIVQGHNFTTLDLFDRDHAAHVLTRFGQAYGRLPENVNSLSREQQAFTKSVIEGLAESEHVVPVRLSLFAEMVKDKSWVPTTLDQMGGTQGIGVAFLDEAFSSRHGNPEHRRHSAAARGVMKSLLPDLGSDIKGHMRSTEELAVASGYGNRSEELAGLLRVLDSELRIITPTERDSATGSDDYNSTVVNYQLTHDYLVPSIRQWLTREQQRTRRGRAELLLAERASLWNTQRQDRNLPTVWEYVQIEFWTKQGTWTETQRRMLSRARKTHAVRWSIGLAVAAVLGLGSWYFVSSLQLRQKNQLLYRDFLNDKLDSVRLIALAEGPRYKDAVAGMEQKLQLAPTSIPLKYEAACVYSLASHSITIDSQLSGNNSSTPLRNAWEDKAFSLLQQLIENKYFDESDRRKHLLGDPDLRHVRTNPKFKNLLEKIDRRRSDRKAVIKGP